MKGKSSKNVHCSVAQEIRCLFQIPNHLKVLISASPVRPLIFLASSWARSVGFPVVWKKDARMVLLLASAFICKIPSANAAFPQVKAVSRRKRWKDGQLVTAGCQH